jgi:hypothetical protein
LGPQRTRAGNRVNDAIEPFQTAGSEVIGLLPRAGGTGVHEQHKAAIPSIPEETQQVNHDLRQALYSGNTF